MVTVIIDSGDCAKPIAEARMFAKKGTITELAGGVGLAGEAFATPRFDDSANS